MLDFMGDYIYGVEALASMIDYLSKNIARLQAVTVTRNPPSQRVLEKTGFKREGALCKFVFLNEELSDFFVYSILREDRTEPKALASMKFAIT